MKTADAIPITAIQVHLWPWSVEISEQTKVCRSGEIRFPFYGMPLLSIEKDASLYLSTRNERFHRMGPEYYNAASGEQYFLWDVPHTFNSRGVNQRTIRLKSAKYTGLIQLAAEFGLPPSELLQKLIGSWNDLFDNLCPENMDQQERGLIDVPWSAVTAYLKNLRKREEPQRSIIVRVAEALSNELPLIIEKARRVLRREQQEVLLSSIRETGREFVPWYVRTEGDTVVMKAGRKRSMPGVIRKESFDTLENRVLKDFLKIAQASANEYLTSARHIPGYEENSNYRRVYNFEATCHEGSLHPNLQSVADLHGAVQPNYVLQSDNRYRAVWEWYKRLRRKRKEADCLWDWQGRLWEDVTRLLVGEALELLASHEIDKQDLRSDLDLEPFKTSNLKLSKEPVSGSRIVPESLPGPFVARLDDGERRTAAVIELVHPDVMDNYALFKTRPYSRLGGHLYLVITPIGQDAATGLPARKTVIIIWAVNGISSEKDFTLNEMTEAAEIALEQHRMLLSVRDATFPRMFGMILANRVKGSSSEVLGRNVSAIRVGGEPRTWLECSERVAYYLHFLVELALG